MPFTSGQHGCEASDAFPCQNSRYGFYFDSRAWGCSCTGMRPGVFVLRFYPAGQGVPCLHIRLGPGPWPGKRLCFGDSKYFVDCSQREFDVMIQKKFHIATAGLQCFESLEAP